MGKRETERERERERERESGDNIRETKIWREKQRE
jgi:hypothetical protein